ncbi:hypothetical protein, conserved [Babesia bigemina]|uniref:Ribosome-binding factor A n=1 Tax=Babesia bigemina TaxID=5866 RepID=A0A061DB98_BABBI|nr:hypothetical protein, conserved [Babesia bigemina]CDR97971.1 hypothetical protein, conserved [Babesia bigemina]|eukprot:XP_012770157.1 hypothetical protein, conserved [Babesia bigemina]
MIALTKLAFLRRHVDRFDILKRQLQRSFLNQSQYKIRHRDELLNDIESAEINAFFERVTGVPLDCQKPGSKDPEECNVAGERTDKKQHVADDGRTSHDFKNVRTEFERQGNFESMRAGSRALQDLTHQERQALQRFEAQSRLADPANLLNKGRAKADPRRDAKHVLRHMQNVTDTHDDMDDDEGDPRAAAMVGENRFDEIVSRIRAQMREEKQENTKINKAKVPNFNGVIVDPIARHVRRRRLRINAMIKDQLQQIITANDPSFILGEHIRASISLERVEMTSGKATIRCYYTVIGGGQDDQRVHEMLQKAQKKVRFCLARKLELGYTPPVLFIRANDADVAHAKRTAKSPDSAFNRPLDVPIKGKATLTLSYTLDKNSTRAVHSENNVGTVLLDKAMPLIDGRHGRLLVVNALKHQVAVPVLQNTLIRGDTAAVYSHITLI